MSYKKIKYVFNPIENIEVIDKDKVLKDISDLVYDKILSHVGGGRSPVMGEGRFKSLSQEYAIKEKHGNFTANLDLSGEMLNNLKVVPKNGKIEVFVTGSSRELLGKVEGHNQHDSSLPPKLPKRRFIPSKLQTWNTEITSEIKKIVKEESDKLRQQESSNNLKDLQGVVNETLKGIKFVYGK